MGKIVTKSVDMNANILYLKHEIVADTSKTQARIEFRNMAYGTITAVKFEAKGYNAFGDVIQIAGKPTFDIVAQDLNIAPKKYAKLDSVLPSKDIRKLDLKLKQVCYANGKIVNVQPEEIVTYEIEEIDENREKLNQQEREARTVLKRRLDEAVCFSKPYGRNWICICGYLNRNTDTICKCCGCREVEMLEEYSEKRVTEKVEEKRRKAAAEQAKREAEQIKFEAEQKRQREEQERREAEERAKAAKRGKIIAGVVGAVTICGVTGFLVNEMVIIPKDKYNHAVSMMESEMYQEAALEFSELGSYKDASEKANEANYENACKLLNEKSYEEAKNAFKELGDYKDSADKITEVEDAKKQEKYDTAMILKEQGKTDKAIEIFETLGNFSDAADQIKGIYYDKACDLLEKGQYTKARDEFEKLGDFKDSKEMAMEAKYQNACSLWSIKKYDEAIAVFKTIENYKDSNEYLNNKDQEIHYQEAIKLLEENKYATAAYSLNKIGDYKDATHVLETVPDKCNEYIKKKAAEQDVSKSNYEAVNLRAQEGVYEIAGIYATIRDLKKEYNEDANHTQDTENLSESLIDGVDKFCIAGIVSFKSLGDLSRYAQGDFFNKGLQLEEQSAEAVWNFVMKIQENDIVDKSTFDNLYATYLKKSYEDIDAWFEEGKGIF